MANPMLMTGTGLLLALALSACATTAPKDTAPSYAYRAQGWGATSCQQLTDDLNNTALSRKQSAANTHLYQSWLSGFISGVNYAWDDTYDVSGNSEVESVLAWLNNYCAEQPEQTIPLALHVLMQEWQRLGNSR